MVIKNYLNPLGLIDGISYEKSVNLEAELVGLLFGFVLFF